MIGIDSSTGMLARCRKTAEEAGVSSLLDLRFGDYTAPPATERVRLVTCPFRAYLHLHTDDERLAALRAARALLEPGGRFVFDVFAPSPDDIRETDGRWIEREPGIWERVDWRPERTAARPLRARRAGRDDDAPGLARRGGLGAASSPRPASSTSSATAGSTASPTAATRTLCSSHIVHRRPVAGAHACGARHRASARARLRCQAPVYRCLAPQVR